MGVPEGIVGDLGRGVGFWRGGEGEAFLGQVDGAAGGGVGGGEEGGEGGEEVVVGEVVFGHCSLFYPCCWGFCLLGRAWMWVKWNCDVGGVVVRIDRQRPNSAV